MPLAPLLLPLVERLDILSRMDRGDASMDECRRQANLGMSNMFSDYALEQAPVEREFDLSISGPGGDIPVRVYLPAEPSEKNIPLHIYLHGGSWWIGDRYFGDLYCRGIVRGLGVAAISLGYRLSPENKFPAALEDSYRLVEWAAKEGRAYGFDDARISIGGSSAGANIAAATALMIKQQGGPRLCGQLLECPALDASMNCASIDKFAGGYLLSKNALQEGWNFYLNPQDRHNPLASPLCASDFSGLPPALIITAQYDPLRDEGELYGAYMQAAGVEVDIRRYDGMTHGFAAFTALLPQARECQQLMLNTLSAWYGCDVA